MIIKNKTINKLLFFYFFYLGEGSLWTTKSRALQMCIGLVLKGRLTSKSMFFYELQSGGFSRTVSLSKWRIRFINNLTAPSTDWFD